MGKDKSPFMALLSLAAIAGNVLFILWILVNGINEGFQGTRIEKLSYLVLTGLLTVNAFLLIRHRRDQDKKRHE